MKKSRFTEEKIIEVLKQLDAGRKVSELSREYGVSTASIYAWKSKYAGLEVSQLKRLKELEEENRKLKTLVADLSLDKVALKWVIEKTDGAGSARRSAARHRALHDERATRLPIAGRGPLQLSLSAQTEGR